MGLFSTEYFISPNFKIITARMNKKTFLTLTLPLLLLTAFSKITIAQTSPVQNIFPKGTITHANIPYAGDTLKKHLLDIYLPAKATGKTPLIVWVHGGAWMLNDKYADMNYMKNTIREFLDKGYALASIDYRHSTTAVFPAQIQDCNQALEYLYDHADQYKFDRNRIALIGFSAGGHLASLLALSHDNNISAFYANGAKPKFSIKCVLDFYGPSDLIAASSSTDTSVNNARSPVAILLGAMPVDRPDIAKRASPVTYVDKNDPPFFIVQGEKDQSVPNTQSKMLSAWLTLAGVKNELVTVPGAPHYGEMFDAEWIREKLFKFLADEFK
jgi:acetyl esterase/lipase